MTIRALTLASALVAAATLIPSASGAQDEPTDRPVSFAPEQAERGRAEFAVECEECHGDDLRGGLNGGPPLRGTAFEEKYFDGLPASVLYAYMSSQMPPQSPGRFSEETYADLMAYVLEWNGVQPGAPLPSDMEALGYLTMEK